MRAARIISPTVCALLVACAAATDPDAVLVNQADPTVGPANAPTIESGSGARSHQHAMHAAAGADGGTAPPNAKLTYYGGPVLKNVNVIPIYWNAKVAFEANLNAFYAAITNSAYFDMLQQYSSIGRGTRGAPYIHKGVTGAITEAQIQAALDQLFGAHAIPQPDANNYYAIHFPPTVTITATADGSRSCVQWCAMHGTYVYNGVNVNYGLIPDQGGGCAGGCGLNAKVVNNLTAVASHELVEAVTDPGVGLVQPGTYGPPLAWYDVRSNAEIGDLCNGQQATVIGGDGKSYVVQKEFSNAALNCVSH